MKQNLSPDQYAYAIQTGDWETGKTLEDQLTANQQKIVNECVRRYKERRAFKTLSNSPHEALQVAISLIAVNVSTEKEYLYLTKFVINEVAEC